MEVRLGRPSGSSLPLPLHTVLLCETAGSTVRVDLGMWFRHGLNWSKIHHADEVLELEGQLQVKSLPGVGSVPGCLAMTCPGLWLDGRAYGKEWLLPLGERA